MITLHKQAPDLELYQPAEIRCQVKLDTTASTRQKQPADQQDGQENVRDSSSDIDNFARGLDTSKEAKENKKPGTEKAE